MPGSGRWVAAGVLLAAAGCSGMQVGQPGRVSGIPGTGAYPGPDGNGNTPRGKSDSPMGGSKMICRDSPAPRGWIALDYVAAGTCAPMSRTEPGPNAALITYYAGMVPETILLVCADQSVPRNWVRVTPEASDASSSRCPRRPGDTATSSTVMRIQRNR